MGDEWQLATSFIIIDGSYNINIKYDKVVAFYLDRVEFGEKLYPAFELLYIDKGPATDFASSWDAGIIYENASYHENEFMFSSATTSYSDTYFQALLEMITGSGIKGLFTREIQT